MFPDIFPRILITAPPPPEPGGLSGAWSWCGDHHSPLYIPVTPVVRTSSRN